MRAHLAVILLATFLVHSSSAGTKDDDGMDGEVTIHGSWKPTFIMLFTRDKCRLAIPDTADSKADLFECERTDKTATCKIRSPSRLDALWQTDAPVAQHTVLMTVTKDTGKTLELSTPRGEIMISSVLKTGVAKLTQTKHRQITCEGNYMTTSDWRNVQRGLREQGAKQDESNDAGTTDDAPDDRSSSQRSSPPARTQPKGLAHGRMCGKDSECESGSCKMENRTRGRCS